jgi:hypothetical protein
MRVSLWGKHSEECPRSITIEGENYEVSKV